MIRGAGVVVATLLATASGPASAADVRSAGALDIELSGFAGMRAHGGALDDQQGDPDLSRGLDFSNDTEIHVIVRRRDDDRGLDYGATVELEADTNVTRNADESWLFVRGAWGELRLGDEDGPIDESGLGGFTVAAGTGGIDGEVIDGIAVDAVLPTTSDTATKIRWYSPFYGDVQLGVSWTPNLDDGDALAPVDVEIGELVEAALIYEGERDAIDVEASMVGSVGEVKEGGDLWTWYLGAVVDLDWLELGGGVGDENVGGQEKRYVNGGVARELGPVYASVTAGRVVRTRGYDDVGEPWNVVVSADLEVAQGLVLAGDLAWVDNDRKDSASEGDDRGWAWVTRLELAF